MSRSAFRSGFTAGVCPVSLGRWMKIEPCCRGSKDFWGFQLSQSLTFPYYCFLLVERKLGEHPDLVCTVHYCALSLSDRTETLAKYLLNERVRKCSLGLGMTEPVRITAHVSCNTGALTLVLWEGLLSISSALWLNDTCNEAQREGSWGNPLGPFQGRYALAHPLNPFLLRTLPFSQLTWT